MILLLGYGFIGKAVYSALKDKGHNVKVISRTVPPNNSDFISADITSIKSFSRAFSGVKTVIHCLHTTVPVSSMNDEIFDIRANLIPFISILDLCKNYKVENFIYLSSGGAVYGKPEKETINESHPTNPVSSYGITKLACEKYLLINKSAFDGNVVILRPSNIYGKEQKTNKPQGIVGHAINACEKSIPLTVWGDGLGKKDYLYIGDFVNAILAVLKYAEKLNEIIFNVSSNELLSVNEIVMQIESRFKSTIDKKYIDSLPFDVQSIAINSSLFRKTFGWKQENDFNTFLKHYENSGR